jgi:uncharacterized protein
VKYLDQYSIAFSGLKPGAHTFEFEAGKKFFEQFKHSEITEGAVAVKVILEKEERLFDLHFDLEGVVEVACDRCNLSLEIEVKGTERLVVKLGDRFEEESESVQVIPESDHKIDLASFIYEYIHLLLPARRVHPDDEKGKSLCDPEVIKKLNELNEHHEPDLRWEALKSLKNKS